MLTTSTRLRLQEILTRIAKGDEVNLEDRVYLHKFADRDQTVSTWLRRARRKQQQFQRKDGLDELLNNLDLVSPDPDSIFRPDHDDLGDWFSGAPSWLSRS